MSEIERLRAELEVLKNRGFIHFTVASAIASVEREIARLEAEAADPWREAKEAIEKWRKMDDGGLVWNPERKAIALVDHLTAENVRLTKRVAELEAEIKAEDDADIADAEKALAEMVQMNQSMGLYEVADMQPPFEGPIVGLVPILDPARVLATAANVLNWRGLQGAAITMSRLSGDAKPYPLKGADNGN